MFRHVPIFLALSLMPARGGQRHSTKGQPADAGKTPRATLMAYHYHRDRGQYTKARALVAKSSLGLVPAKDGKGMSERAQRLRGFAIDHEQVAEKQATVYFRTWFSLATKARGGRPTVAKLVNEDGRWKLDLKATMQLTAAVKKGKDKFGFYDGNKQWWR